MIFTNKKFIFVHLPKTGGSTLRYLLAKCQRPVLGNNINTKLGMHFKLFQVPITYPELDMNEYTVLVVKRPPWERLASLFVMGHRAYDMGRIPNRTNDRAVDYFTRVGCKELFLRTISIDGQVHPRIHALDFNNYEHDIRHFFSTELNKDLGNLPTIGKRPESKYRELYLSTLADKEFMDLAVSNSQEEIAYFGYTIPS